MSQRTLFVFNIPEDLPERELHEQFSYFGRVRHIRLMRDKGYGFVEMGRSDEAATAIKGINGIVLRGNSIKVEPARSRRKRRSSNPPDHDNAPSNA